MTFTEQSEQLEYATMIFYYLNSTPFPKHEATSIIAPPLPLPPRLDASAS